MNPVEVDLSNFLDAEDKATRRHDLWRDDVLENLVSDIFYDECKAITLGDVLDDTNAKDLAPMLSKICISSGDDLILARDALDKWMTERVRDYCEESEELDRRIWDRDESERNGNV